MSAPRARDDRGALSANVWAVQLAVLVLFAVVQVSLWFYGRAVATAAAQHGLDSARVATGSESAAITTVNQFLAQVGGLDLTSVEVQRSATEVTVAIDGEVPSVVPFFDVPVTVSLSAPVERIVE
jgi:hypothetical protein